MPKKPPGSGKGKGSITQSADNQNVRISQVSNVSAAVTAMGKQTTLQMKETERRVAEGGDTKEIAGSMTGVLHSLKKTVDSLEKGVQTATLGTAKAAQDAIKQYGDAISEDFKVNRANMVASALATSTPIFGYFASKFMETGIFKQTKEKLNQKISGMFGGDKGGMGMSGKDAAESMKMSKDKMKKGKKDAVDAYRIANREQVQSYEEPRDKRLLEAVTAIQSALGAQVGKYAQWYQKFLVEHPYYRFTTRAMKAIAWTLPTTAWKAVYFFWRPRGGYKKHLSKSKKPLEAINQNIGALFVQTMPRLDAIMIYTKATAMATRDLSTHVTGQKYPRMDPSQLGGTWSLAGGTMKFVRAVAGAAAATGRGLLKAGRWGVGKATTEGSMTNKILMESLNTLGLMGTGVGGVAKGLDWTVTSPAKLKNWMMPRLPIIGSGIRERKRMFGGLGATGGGAVDPMTLVMMQMMGQQGGQKPITDPSRLIPAPAAAEKQKKKWFSKIRMPKFLKGMKRREKPHFITQGVYDLYARHQKQEELKKQKLLLGYTKDTAKYMEKHDKREKRRSVWDFFKTIGGSILSVVMAIVSNPMAWLAGAIAAVSGLVVAAFHKYITPKIQKWVDEQMDKAREIGKQSQVTGKELADMRSGDVQSASEIAMKAGIRAGTGPTSDLPTMMQNYAEAFIGGRYEYMKEHIAEYGDFTVEEIRQFRKQHMRRAGTRLKIRTGGGRAAALGFWNAEKARRAGRAVEKDFLEWLKDDKKDEIMGDPALKAKWDANRKKLDAAREKYGKDKSTRDLQMLDRAEKHQKAADERKKKELGETSGKFTLEQAKEWALKHGGEAKEYLGKTLNEATEIAKKYTDKFVAEVKAGATLTSEKVKELSTKYGVPASELANKTLSEATEYAKVYKEKIVKTAKEYGVPAAELYNKTLAEATAFAKNYKDKIAQTVKEKAPEAQQWIGTQWEAMKKYKDDPRFQEARDKMGAWSASAIQKTGEYIELGKGNFVEVYRQGTGKLKEMWDTAAPEKKEIIKRQLEAALASGKITAAQLKEMGIELKDATLEAGEKLQNTVASTGVYTTQSIQNTVNNTQSGGGGNTNKMVQERTMDDICMGEVLF